VELYLLQCRRCRTSFLLCRRCYRGQRFCSDPCRTAADRENRRRARRKYRESREGKEQHRDEEVRRRARKGGGVGDKGREPAPPQGIVRCQEAAIVPKEKSKKTAGYTVFTVVYEPSLESEARQLLGAWVSCARCRRAGPVLALRPQWRRGW
jgi:hypothetical protein